MTHLFPTAQLKNRGVEAQGHKFFYIIFYLYVLLNQIRDNHIFTKDWQLLRRKKKVRTKEVRGCFLCVWSENAALVKRLMKIHSSSQMYYGFNSEQAFRIEGGRINRSRRSAQALNCITDNAQLIQHASHSNTCMYPQDGESLYNKWPLFIPIHNNKANGLMLDIFNHYLIGCSQISTLLFMQFERVQHHGLVP